VERFKAGDLVRVRDGTHDPSMPAHRVGVIIEDSASPRAQTKTYKILFLGTYEILQFHEMFLEHFNNNTS
tara:strand:+ start:8630 stop:8839 length:210 start_codon:yes stop_codon:yes gene_type:complete